MTATKITDNNEDNQFCSANISRAKKEGKFSGIHLFRNGTLKGLQVPVTSQGLFLSFTIFELGKSSLNISSMSILLH